MINICLQGLILKKDWRCWISLVFQFCTFKVQSFKMPFTFFLPNYCKCRCKDKKYFCVARLDDIWIFMIYFISNMWFEPCISIFKIIFRRNIIIIQGNLNITTSFAPNKIIWCKIKLRWKMNHLSQFWVGCRMGGI